jgi:hypothetical protein
MLGLALLLGTGCEDNKQCDESVATLKKSIEVKDFAAARNWRDYAWKACSERAVFATLDKAILDGEAGELQRVADAAKQVAAEGKKRINAAQRLWLGFDAQDKAARTAPALAAVLEQAKRLESGLPPQYAQQIAAYNQAQYDKRRVALPK